MTDAATSRRAGRREWVGLAVIALPCLLYAMDLTVLYLAVPHLSADLQPSSAQLLWITDVYGFLVAGLLAARALLGVAGATLAPSTLSLVRNMFLDPKQRTVAVAVWISSFSVGGVLALASLPDGVGRTTQPGNASVLPGDYPRALASVVGLGWTGVLALAAGRHLRARGWIVRIRAP